MVGSDTYKRNQIEWTLWRLFRSEPSTLDQPPAVFRNRIKRLLEIDRDVERFEESEVPARRFAFFDEEPQGRGSEARFSAFNVFTLALALDLLDTGFKQAEIVFLLRLTFERFEAAYRLIQRNPPAPPDLILATDRPNAPVHLVNDTEYADCRVFVILEKVELTETTSGAPKRARNKLPILIEPKVCRGIGELTAELDQMGPDFRKVVVLELANLAILVGEWLVKAPLVLRGRG